LFNTQIWIRKSSGCTISEKKYQYRLVCPNGFEWFDQTGCVAIITTPANKESAINQCKSLNPSAQLMMPKTDFLQSKLEQFLANRDHSNNT
jgi:hypothetical protein